ncbi:MAG: hypothetical protein JSV80_13120, partial [Acidobacteriota bacterium]
MRPRNAPKSYRGRHLELLCGLLVVLLCGAARSPRIVYDGEFGGYLPIFGGIERPDLVADEETGRVPITQRTASQRARRALKRAPSEIVHGQRLVAVDPSRLRGSEKPSRSWLRRQGVRTSLELRGPAGEPVAGARVFRYHDPSFYPVNEDQQGARLYASYRFLPHPFPAFIALRLVLLHEESWRDAYMVPVSAIGPDISAEMNPWSRDEHPLPTLPIEYVGRTDGSGRLRVLSGVFNLRDRRKFRSALVPRALR